MTTGVATTHFLKKATYGLLAGAFCAFLFISSASAQALPAQCPGTIADYNVIEGSAADDTLTGTAADDYIIGDGGKDSIDGRGGNDCIVADDGNDTVLAGSGNDVILVGGENNSINAGDGHNVIIAGSGRDNITTGSGDDRIVAGDGNNTIRTNAGNDHITAGNGNDYINAGSGDDVCYPGSGRNITTSCEFVDEENDVPDEGNSDPGSGEGNTGGDDTSGDNGNTDSNNGSSGGDNSDTSDDNSSNDTTTGGGGGVNSPANGGIQFLAGGGVPPILITENEYQVIGPGHIKVSWRSNIPATSQIVYGTVSQPNGQAPQYAYPSATAETSNIDIFHSLELSGLEPGSTYYFRAVSDIENSDEGISNEMSYGVPAAEEVRDDEGFILALSTDGDPALTGDASSEITTVEPQGIGSMENNENKGAVALIAGEEGENIDPVAGSALAISAVPFMQGGFFLLLLLLLILALAVWFVASRKGRETR